MHIMTRPLILGALASAMVLSPVEGQQHDSDDWLVASAVLALPEGLRAGAEVRAWQGDGSLREVRAGSNGMICLADRPGDGFSAACYHDSLEPFMARGRELTDAGVEGMQRHEARWREARAGTLAMPEGAAMVYNIRFESEAIDPSTADPADGGRLHAVYIPYATQESTGLPAEPTAGSAPWLMWPGEPSAHVMIMLPPRGDGS